MTTKYLYDIEPSSLAKMPYEKALEYKIKCTKELLIKLLSIQFENRDDERIKAVYKANKFNINLLNELKE